MVVLAVGVVATVVTAGAAAPVAAAATGSVASGAAVGGAGAAAVAGATAGGAGAVAVAGTTAGGAGAVAVAGATAGGATGAATAAGTTAGILSGPVGWCILGTEKNPSNGETQSFGVYTYDCWKIVLHDDSPDPSSGMLLRDVICDPRVKQVTVTDNTDSDLPRLVLDNIWNEKFLIEYLYLNNTKLAAHAVKI